MAVERAQAAQSKIRQHLDLVVVAIKKKSAIIGFNPNSEPVIDAGDGLNELGSAESLRCMEEIPD